MLGRRRAGYYPGILSNILEVNSIMFLDPTDDFINAHLQLVIDGERRGQRPPGCPLFNAQIGDGHFSPLGSEVWAASVGRRLVLLFEKGTSRPSESSVRPATRTIGRPDRRDPDRPWPARIRGDRRAEFRVARGVDRCEQGERQTAIVVDDPVGVPPIAMGTGRESNRYARGGTGSASSRSSNEASVSVASSRS